MNQFINDYPIFSYIAVPILLITLVALTYFVLRPRSVGSHFALLYDQTLAAIDYVRAGENAFTQAHLKTLSQMLCKMKSSYELLESEELYEVEGVIANIKKAKSITRALIVAKSSEIEISDFLGEIMAELSQVRKVLYGFSLTREEDKAELMSILTKLNAKKDKEKAAEYLRSIKENHPAQH